MEINPIFFLVDTDDISLTVLKYIFALGGLRKDDSI
jgi:hypothetical protein